MTKAMFFGGCILLALQLSGCSGDNNGDNQRDNIHTVEIADIVADIESGGHLYDGKVITISAKYFIHIPSSDCDGFCFATGDIFTAVPPADLESLEDEITFVNTYAPYSFNLCGIVVNEIQAQGYSIPVINYPPPDDSEAIVSDCDFSSGEEPIKLRGTLIYTPVLDYCSLVQQPSARFTLDDVTIAQLPAIMACETPQ